MEGGRGVPPLSVKKKSIKNWPKNGIFWAKNDVFVANKSVFGNRSSVKGGRGTPFSVKKFLLTFWENLVRDWGYYYKHSVALSSNPDNGSSGVIRLF